MHHHVQSARSPRRRERLLNLAEHRATPAVLPVAADDGAPLPAAPSESLVPSPAMAETSAPTLG